MTEAPGIRLHPRDRIASRSLCWRPVCRARFGVYRTITVLVGGRFVVAFCHRAILDELDHKADRWKYGGEAES